MERMSHTLLSMLDDYNTLLQRKALFPSWSECSACVPGPQKALTFSTRGGQKKAQRSSKHKKPRAREHRLASRSAPAFASPMLLQYLKRRSNRHFARGCMGRVGPFSRNLNWNDPSLFVRASAETGFGHDTFGENHLYLAPNQARRVISAGRHWAAAISCPLISLKGGLGQYTLRNRANNALVVLHKGSHKLWHGVKTPAAYLVLSAVLLPSIRADLPSHPPKPWPTKPAFTGWSGTCSCRVTASHRCPD